MRFTVGQDYFFARTLFERSNNNWFNLYRPWCEKLEAIEVIKLTCTEHHKVAAWDQDPNGNKEHDGFVFKDENGDVWYNQYPTACYGQMDDTNDRVVFRHFETHEVFETDENGKIVNDVDGNAVVKNQKMCDLFDDTFWRARFTLATNFVDKVKQGLGTDRDGRYIITDAHKRIAMMDYLKKLTAAIEECSGKKLKFAPLSMRRTDGTMLVVKHLMVSELV